ncbi:TonB-dependent receptor [Nonlabens ulvanivorans]|uniref:Iron complex outermembrane receptor protein n=1 Tax=Nonlabens ulvanivorans TaxID=906888 RepID=A0A084JXW3_NONUL|nr:TonB-dependent receptor [Nonlabens ulvanivorans]KEZ93797.1 TonB-dependent receptor [Nonlabens ulvanivorans]PRX14401.1 iron complex outermembrane receptor protein [Nonlabens ulvanivorans]
MKLQTLWLFVMLISASWATAQDCTYILEGTVKDYHDNSSLELATIYVESLQKTVSTDVNGYFILKGLCTGTYNLSIAHIDCEPKKITVDLTGSQKIEILLEHHVEDLQTIQVIADVHDDHSNTQATTRIKKEILQNFSGATLGDALTSVAGVSSLKTGNSVVKPVVHGLYGSRVAIVHDGIRQQDQEWGIEHAPNIDVNTANSIQVIKGASALRYGGDAIGGTIVIEPARIISKDTLSGSIISQLQTNGRGGSITGSINNYRKSGWYQQATLTYKRLGDYDAPDYVLSNTGSETAAFNLGLGFKTFEYGADLKYSYYESSLGILRASHIGNAADLVRSINSGVPTVINDFTYDIDVPRQEVAHHSLRLSSFKRFAGLGKLEADYSLQFNNRKEYDIRRGSNAGRASLDMDLMTHIAAINMLFDSNKTTTINVGLDGMYQVNTPDANTGVRRLIPDYDATKVGAYISINHQLKDNWIIDAGLRLDSYKIDADKFYFQTRWESLGYDEQFPQFERRTEGNQLLTNPILDYGLYAFTVGTKYFFNDHYDIAVNLSSANRAPNPSELFSDGLHHALATIELGRLDLAKEQSYKLNTTFHFNHKNLDLELNPYLNLVNDFIQLVPTSIETTTRGAFPVYQYEQLDARLLGIDVSASYDVFAKKEADVTEEGGLNSNQQRLLNFNSQFSYIHGTDVDANEALIDMPPAQFSNTITWFNAINIGLDFHLTNQTTLEQTRFPDNDYEVNVPLETGGFEMREVNISQPPSAYSLWNAGVSYSFFSKKNPKVKRSLLKLSVFNIFNTNYRNYLNRQRFYADDIGRDIQLQFIYNI